MIRQAPNIVDKLVINIPIKGYTIYLNVFSIKSQNTVYGLFSKLGGNIPETIHKNNL